MSAQALWLGGTLVDGDRFDLELLENCRPSDWRNPEPKRRYNLVVVGGGTAGLVAAGGMAILGARVALVERRLTGGDCLVYGCVPSKALIRASRAAYDVRAASELGVHTGEVEVDFAAAMARMRRLRAQMSPADSARRFAEMGVDVFYGDARFVAEDAVEVEGARLRFDRAVVASGGRPSTIDVPGLDAGDYRTNETIFTLTSRPERLLVVGGGPVGSELAQAFRRLGSHVTVVTGGDRLLPREDDDAGGIVERQFEREGIRVVAAGRLARVERSGDTRVATIESRGETLPVEVDEILVAVGRRANVEGLGLDAASVRYDERGVDVDDRLRTSNRRIYACGDVCSGYKFTHAADAMARIVWRNAFLFGRRRVSDLVMPWCTYTDPEVAHVGLYERDARARGIDVATITHALADVDRAVLDGDIDGFARVHYDRSSKRILGGTIVARHAGEMIGELTLAIRAQRKIGDLAETIHPYPTQAEAIRKIGDVYLQTTLGPAIKGLLAAWFAWRR